MKFAFNQMGFPYDDFEKNCDCIRTAGYEGVEPRVSEHRLENPEQFEHLHSIARDCGLEIPSVAGGALGWTSLSTPDKDARNRALELGMDLIETLGTSLDVETLLLVPGQVTEDTPYEAVYDNTLDSIRTLASTADQYDVTIALENVTGNDFLTSPLEFASFIDEASAAGPVKAYFDIGNSLKYGYAEQWIRVLDDRIDRIHVKDHRRDTGNATYPLQGDVNWPAVAAALDEIGYDGWIAPELPPYRSLDDRMPAQILENMRAIFTAE